MRSVCGEAEGEFDLGLSSAWSSLQKRVGAIRGDFKMLCNNLSDDDLNVKGNRPIAHKIQESLENLNQGRLHKQFLILQTDLIATHVR